MKTSANLYKRIVLLLICVSLPVILFTRYFLPTADSASKSSKTEFISDYDIRSEQNESVKEITESFIENAGQTEKSIQLNKKNSYRAIEKLRSNFPKLTIEYNKDLNIPEIIDFTNDAKTHISVSKKLGNRADILREFISQNSEIFGLSPTQISQLILTADYTNPNDVLSFVTFEQRIKEIPVFRGEIKAGFTKHNKIFRIVNNLAPNLENTTVSEDFGTAEKAVLNAAEHLNLQTTHDIKPVAEDANKLKVTFESEQFADLITAEKIYFPIDFGVVRSAWRVLLWSKQDAFYLIVDAQNGTLLWRKKLTDYQTQTATYNIYGNTTSPMKTADSPSPFTPGCLTIILCSQPFASNRTNFTLVGNESPYEFNNTGWIPDGENRTIGNNIEAGIDRASPNGIDENGWAFAQPNRVFNYSFNPAPGNPVPGEEPLPSTQTYPPSNFQQGSVAHVFYTANRWHDETYRLGFNEAARNFQTDNFGRGGIGNDSISVEIQDWTSTNSANFAVTADGARPRAQFFIWTGATPDRDGALDSQIVVHELTHGLSSRLHGNSSGLNSNMARGMNEGWSDFFALALLSESNDARLGTNAVGGYATYQLFAGFDTNYYYGIRRYPTTIWAFTGENDCRHNPLTFADIDVTQFNTDNGCFARNPIGSTTADQIHNLGEVWSSILWEVRDKLIQQHGTTEGNRRVLQYIMDGMKIAPLNPTFLQERDAILAAVQASDISDVSAVWAGFAVRGLGWTASIQNAGTGANNTRVTESFSVPNVNLTSPFTVSDIMGNNNGYPESGELITLNVSLINNTGATVTGVLLNINGTSATTYGTINPGQTIARQINYQIPINAACPGNFNLTFNINSSAGSSIENRQIFLGVPISSPVSFTNSTPIDIPNGQPTTTLGIANPYPSTINVAGLSGNKRIRLTLNDFRHEFGNDIDMLLVGPQGQKFIFASDIGGTTAQSTPIDFSITDTAENILPETARLVDGAEYRPSNSGANDVFEMPAPAAPYENAAPSGTSTFSSVFGTNGSNLNGTWSLYIVDDANTDSGRIEGGWKLTFESAQYFCPICRLCTPITGARSDFDGDGKTDLSVFRPSEGNWYLNRSTTGFSAVNWGISSDILTPGDFDGDGRADPAVFRNGVWYVLKSNTTTFQAINWGLSDDIPIAGDFDGDGKTDPAVFRPSNGFWYVLNSFNNQFISIQFGLSGDIPISGDFDGDGKNDFVVYRNGVWYMQRSIAGFQAVSFGLDNDNPVPADYNGDGKDDIAVFRASEGNWYWLNSSTGSFSAIHFGQPNDIPVPGDYDGDIKNDQAVYRNGIWYLNRSSSGFSVADFGISNDIPIPKKYIP